MPSASRRIKGTHYQLDLSRLVLTLTTSCCRVCQGWPLATVNAPSPAPFRTPCFGMKSVRAAHTFFKHVLTFRRDKKLQTHPAYLMPHPRTSLSPKNRTSLSPKNPGSVYRRTISEIKTKTVPVLMATFL